MSCSTGSTIARASSGSRSRISSVDPLMSANSAVTVLRSPSITPASAEVCSGATCMPGASPGDDEVTAAAPALFVSGGPPLPQKSDVERFSALHFAQCFTSAFPHFAQKLLADGLLVQHFEQRIGLPTEQNDGLASCTTPVTQRALRIKPSAGDQCQVVLGRSVCVRGEGRQANEP